MRRELVGFLTLFAIVVFVAIAELSTEVTFDCGVGCSFSSTEEPFLDLWGVLISVCAVFFPQLAPVDRADKDVSLWRRTCALVVDFHIAVMGSVAIVLFLLRMSLLPIAQTWNWGELEAASPIVGPMNTLGVIVGFTLIYLYFRIPSETGRATVGQYIMGFQVVPDEERPQFWLRPLIGYVAICSIMIWIWFDSKGVSEGRYWWDRLSGTRPIMVSA